MNAWVQRVEEECSDCLSLALPRLELRAQGLQARRSNPPTASDTITGSG